MVTNHRESYSASVQIKKCKGRHGGGVLLSEPKFKGVKMPCIAESKSSLSAGRSITRSNFSQKAEKW